MTEAKKKKGRPAVSMGDLIIALSLATYFNRPSRKAVTWAGAVGEWLFAAGRAPAAVTLRFAMRTEGLTRYLRHALQLTSNCVRTLETRFAVDSSYYKTPNSTIHIQRLGTGTMVTEKIMNAKMHVAVGLKSLMVTGVVVSDGDTNDGAVFLEVLNQFNHRFRIDQILADAAYDMPMNYEAVAACGGRAFFDQKSNTKKNGSPHHDEMVELRNEYYDSWNEEYRFRSLVETANSIMKRTIKRVIRARTETARDNELLLVCLVYNLLRLIEARLAHGVEIPWADPAILAAIDRLGDQPQAA